MYSMVVMYSHVSFCRSKGKQYNVLKLGHYDCKFVFIDLYHAYQGYKGYTGLAFVISLSK